MRSKFWRLFKKEEGQILLIVVLVMVTSLTVGLALVSRSITNIRTSTEESNSQKALSAAEAGIEREIHTKGSGSIGNTDLGNNASYSTSITPIGQDNVLSVKNGGTIDVDEPQDVWLVRYEEDFINASSNAGWAGTGLTIFWGTHGSNPCQDAALEVLVLTKPKTAPVLDKYAVEPCSSRRSANNFSDNPSAGDNGGVVLGTTYAHSKTITVGSPGEGLVMRIIPIYHSTIIGIRSVGNVNFPRQGFVINSTGTSGVTERKVTVYQGYPRLPSELFPYNLFLP